MAGAVFWFICVREAYPAALPIAASSQVNFNRATVNAIAGLRKSRHGIGDLLARPNANAIKDHLLCDGSAVSRIAFPQLFEAIGTDWGAGDGATTFNLPNLNSGTLPVPVAVPPQQIGDGGTVTTGTPTPSPTPTPAQTGGVGGNVTTGGRTPRLLYEADDLR
jgi:hypothetical protein